MSPRGRRASAPRAGHARPEYVGPDGLVVHHYNFEGRVKDYDFSMLPVAEPMQRSLAALFAARCVPHRWTAHVTSESYWARLTTFAAFLSRQESPPLDLDELTAVLVKQWYASLTHAVAYSLFREVAGLLQDDPRLQTGPVADELARRVRQPRSGTQSYSEAELDRVRIAARRMFRAALLRIEDNAGHLRRWHDGAFPAHSREHVVGEGLDILARVGDLPRYLDKNGKYSLVSRFRTAFGGTRAEVTWGRLFLSQREAAALGVLLLAEFGWNLSVIDRAEVPQATPDPGDDGGDGRGRSTASRWTSAAAAAGTGSRPATSPTTAPARRGA